MLGWWGRGRRRDRRVDALAARQDRLARRVRRLERRLTRERESRVRTTAAVKQVRERLVAVETGLVTLNRAVDATNRTQGVDQRETRRLAIEQIQAFELLLVDVRAMRRDLDAATDAVADAAERRTRGGPR